MIFFEKNDVISCHFVCPLWPPTKIQLQQDFTNPVCTMARVSSSLQTWDDPCWTSCLQSSWHKPILVFPIIVMIFNAKSKWWLSMSYLKGFRYLREQYLNLQFREPNEMFLKQSGTVVVYTGRSIRNLLDLAENLSRKLLNNLTTLNILKVIQVSMYMMCMHAYIR